MTDFELDLDRLGDVWRQHPDPSELAELQRAADGVRRRARWAQLLDLVSALVVGAVVLFLVLSNAKVDTLLIGGAAILLLLGSQIRDRRLRREELRGLTGSTEQMLDQSIRRVQATLKRRGFHLMLMIPGIVLGVTVGRLADAGAGGGNLTRLFPDPMVRLVVLTGALAVLGITAVYLARSKTRERQELERLISLRDSYRDEPGFAPDE